MYVCMSVCMYVCMYACMYICMYDIFACIYVCMHACMYMVYFTEVYVCMCDCITYIHTYINLRSSFTVYTYIHTYIYTLDRYKGYLICCDFERLEMLQLALNRRYLATEITSYLCMYVCVCMYVCRTGCVQYQLRQMIDFGHWTIAQTVPTPPYIHTFIHTLLTN